MTIVLDAHLYVGMHLHPYKILRIHRLACNSKSCVVNTTQSRNFQYCMSEDHIFLTVTVTQHTCVQAAKTVENNGNGLN